MYINSKESNIFDFSINSQNRVNEWFELGMKKIKMWIKLRKFYGYLYIYIYDKYKKWMKYWDIWVILYINYILWFNSLINNEIPKNLISLYHLFLF